MSQTKKLSYPFVPRSTLSLKPGHFWSVPLSDGTFSCGRVIQLLPEGTYRRRVWFLAGLLDWNAKAPPSAAAIAGARCISQGKMHLMGISENGGVILGFRELSLDNVEPFHFRGAMHHMNSQVHYGTLPVRAQTPEDSYLPVLSVWGNRSAIAKAEERFVQWRRRHGDRPCEE